jgi:hypothetical protein
MLNEKSAGAPFLDSTTDTRSGLEKNPPRTAMSMPAVDPATCSRSRTIPLVARTAQRDRSRGKVRSYLPVTECGPAETPGELATRVPSDLTVAQWGPLEGALRAVDTPTVITSNPVATSKIAARRGTGTPSIADSS